MLLCYKVGGEQVGWDIAGNPGSTLWFSTSDTPSLIIDANCEIAIDMLIRNHHIVADRQLYVNGASAMTTNDTGIEEGAAAEEEGSKTAEYPGEERKEAVIEVNSQKVEMAEGSVTGLEIKEAAIGQGVRIKLNFVLQQEMPNGTAKVVGDDDKILIRGYLGFTAIEPDDNS